MNPKICSAIATKNLIEFSYGGGTRIVEPHCHGITTAGNPGLRGHQVGGFSSTGTMGWKMFDLSKAGPVTISNQKFIPRPDYKKNDKGMSKIFCEV